MLRHYNLNEKRMDSRSLSNSWVPPASQRPALKMNGLRMYLRPVDKERSGSKVFYSRRGDGPYYVWRYEEKLGQWRGSRVNTSDFAPRELLMANWKVVPSALQTKLGEHYLD